MDPERKTLLQNFIAISQVSPSRIYFGHRLDFFCKAKEASGSLKIYFSLAASESLEFIQVSRRIKVLRFWSVALSLSPFRSAQYGYKRNSLYLFSSFL